MDKLHLYAIEESFTVYAAKKLYEDSLIIERNVIVMSQLKSQIESANIQIGKLNMLRNQLKSKCNEVDLLKVTSKQMDTERAILTEKLCKKQQQVARLHELRLRF